MCCRQRRTGRSDHQFTFVSKDLDCFAWLAAPDDARVLRAATDTWLGRLRREAIPTQEAVEYVEHLVTLRVQLEATPRPAAALSPR